MIRRCCPSSLPHTLENRIAFVLILAEALISIEQTAQAQIAFSSARNGDLDIYVMDEDGSNVTRLTNHPHADSSPAWSPDGKRIAFASNRHGTGDIYLMNAAGGNVERLTHDDTNRSPYDWAPEWSPDGRFIAFESTRGGRGSDIWLMKPDGTKPIQLSKHAGHDTSPAWSPDGKQIAFASRDGKNFTWEIHRIDVDGGNIKNLTNNLANDTRPAWATSGERIAFSSDRDGDYDIYAMKPDGVDVLRLTNHPAGDYALLGFPTRWQFRH